MKHLTPQQKRAAQVAGVAGLILLVVMLARRQSAANAGPDSADPGATGTAVPTSSGAPANFSDDQTGNLSDIANTVSGGLGDIGTGLTQLGSNQQELASGQQSIVDTLGLLSGGLAATQASVDSIVPSLQSGGFTPATAGTPGPAAGAGSAAAAKRKTAAAAKTKTVIKHSEKFGRDYVYHVTPGHKPVAVRPATHAVAHTTTPHRTPSQKPAAHKPAPKKPAPKKKGHR